MHVLFPHKLVKKKCFLSVKVHRPSTHRIRIRSILVWKHFRLAMTHQAHLQRRGKEMVLLELKQTGRECRSFFQKKKGTHLKMIQQFFADCIRRTDHHL